MGKRPNEGEITAVQTTSWMRTSVWLRTHCMLGRSSPSRVRVCVCVCVDHVTRLPAVTVEVRNSADEFQGFLVQARSLDAGGGKRKSSPHVLQPHTGLKYWKDGRVAMAATCQSQYSPALNRPAVSGTRDHGRMNEMTAGQ